MPQHTGPVFRDTRTLAANVSIDPVDARGWIYRRLPWPAQVSYALDADAVGVVITITVGSDMQVGPEDPVPAGGAAGVFPNQDEDFSNLLGAAGDLLTFLVRETAGVATTDINLVIKLNPLL